LSDRLSYLFAVAILLLAGWFRLHEVIGLPAGLSAGELDNVRIIETARAGTIETFYNLNGVGREPLYQIVAAALTSLTGSGVLGYRFLSVIVSMLTLALVYVLGKRLYGATGGLVALALLAVGFYPSLLGRNVLPETMLPLLMVATLLALAQALSVDRAQNARVPNSTSFAALGLLLGFGFYVHPLHFAIVLSAMIFIGYVVLTRQAISRNALGFTSFAILVMIIIAMPYLIASIRQPELAGAGRIFAGSDPSIFGSIVNSIFGIFFRGDSDPLHNLPGRPLFDLVTGFLILIGLLLCIRGWRRPRYALVLIGLLVALPFVVIAPASPDFTRLALAMPLLALLAGATVSVISQRLRRVPRLLFAIGLLGLFGFNVYWTTQDLFTHWRALPAAQSAYNVRLGQLAHYLDRTADTLPTVICTPELYPPDDAPQLISAQIMALMMHRQTLPLRYADCGMGLVLANGGETQQVVFLEATGLQRMSPYLRQWIDGGQMLTSSDLPAQSVVVLNVRDRLADTIGRFTTTAPATFAPETGVSDPLAEIPVRLGGNISFLGYDRVTEDAFGLGAVVPVYTYWRVDGTVPQDLRLFVHLLSDPTVIAVQADGLAVRADLLLPRDIIVQATLLQLPFTIPEGEYILSVGAYERTRGTRLGVFDGEQLRGDRLFVGRITIAR
jgi:hypothetical protein